MEALRLLGSALLLWLVLSAPAFAAERIAIIVHPTRATDEITTLDIKRIFLKRQRYWSGRDPVIPVNREHDARERERFTVAILGTDAGRLEQYWNKQYFRGVLPPATMVSGEAVKRFVAQEPGAIGYVVESLVDESVKVVTFIE